MAESEMDSLHQRVLQRAKELNRLKTGKASETISANCIETNANGNSQLLSGSGTDGMAEPERESPASSHVTENSERGELHQMGSSGNTSQLWEKLSKMEELMRKKDEEHADILSNVVLSVAKLDRKLDLEQKPTEQRSSSSQDVLDLPNDDDQSDELDRILDENESRSCSILQDLEDSYKEEVVLGPAVSEKLGELLNNAIDRPLSENAMKELEGKHRIPKNCSKMGVPKVNRELWQAFKPTRPADLAMQSSQKYMSMAMVPVIKTLEVLMTEGDLGKVKELTKDTFRFLAQGIHANMKKRRELIKPLVPAKYRKVCDTEQSSGDYLFGDNLDQQVEDIEKEDRRAQKLSGHAKSNYTRPFLGQRLPKGSYYHYDQKQAKRPKPYHRNVIQSRPGKPQPKGQIRRK